MTDNETSKWLWSRAQTSGERAQILRGVASRGDSETFKWFWTRAHTSAERAQILGGVASRGDSETFKWFWTRAHTSTERAQILRAVASRGDSETSKWFWAQAHTIEEKDILLSSSPKPTQVLREAEGREEYQADYDVFISHASEDKESFVRELANELSQRGVKVWYDECALSLGDSLRRSIDRGLAASRFGVVILSPSFFSKEWPQKELDGLVAKESGGRKVILPVWHNVTRTEVAHYSLTLSDRLAVSTDRGMSHVVAQILQAIQQPL